MVRFCIIKEELFNSYSTSFAFHHSMCDVLRLIHKDKLIQGRDGKLMCTLFLFIQEVR